MILSFREAFQNNSLSADCDAEKRFLNGRPACLSYEIDRLDAFSLLNREDLDVERFT